MAQRNRFVNIPNEVRLDDTSFTDRIFNRDIVLDIGCGHGDFIIDFAPRFTSKLYIGIEVWRKRAHKTAHRLTKRNITNFLIVVSAGENALKTLFPAESVDEININFPDPWLRERYWKKRILKPSFLIETVRVLKIGGVLNFVTDVDEYANYASSLILRFPYFRSNYNPTIQKNIYQEFPTLFYRKMSPLRNINYLSFTKINGVNDVD